MSTPTSADPTTRRAQLLSELVGINSVNPGQAGERSGPGGERMLAEFVAERAGALGAEVVLDEAEPGRPNVYARFQGRSDRVVAVAVAHEREIVRPEFDHPEIGLEPRRAEIGDRGDAGSDRAVRSEQVTPPRRSGADLPSAHPGAKLDQSSTCTPRQKAM